MRKSIIALCAFVALSLGLSQPAPAQVLGGGGTVANIPSAYLGPVATRNGINRSTIGTVGRYANAATTHVATDDIIALRVLDVGAVFPGAGSETALGCDVPIRLGVEYPIGGTVAQGTYGGSTTGTIPNGGLLLSDWVSITIPAGGVFRTRRNLASPCALGYLTDWVGVTGDGLDISATPVTDRSISGTIAAFAGSQIPPVAVLGMTRKGTVVFLASDSKVRGLLDATGTAYDTGEFARSIGGAGVGYINLAVSGDTLQAYVASHTLRQQIAAYGRTRLIESGVNDMAASRTAAQMAGDLISIVGYQGGAPTWVSTITPKPSTTDACTTLANQTLPGNESNRVLLNNNLLSGAVAFVPGTVRGVIDLSGAVSDPTTPGKWKVAPVPWSNDCTHETTFGAQSIQASGVIPTAASMAR